MAKTLGVVGNAIKDMSSARDRATRKGIEIAKIGSNARKNVEFSGTDYDIEIVSINAIDDGVEVFARAWNPDGKQIGFGRDGSVDIERFRIINPPILVPDGTKTLTKNLDGKDVFLDNFKEDLQEAILQSLNHVVSVKKQKFSSDKIISGKVGNTTSTFYPAAGANSPVDGDVFHTSSNQNWTTLVGGTGTGANDTAASNPIWDFECWNVSNKFNRIRRSIFLFDTSSIPTDDIIDSAVLSIYGAGKVDQTGSTPTVNIYSSAPASNDALVSGDFDSIGSTAFATAITYAGWSTSSYNDFTLNASGLSTIDESGLSKFGVRNPEYDVADSAPNWGSFQVSNIEGRYADTSGTSQDPKLVVEHSAASTDYPINASETPAITEIFGRTIAVSPLLAIESATPTEIFSRNFSITAFLQTESVAITESLSRGLAKIINLTESISITDTLQALSAKVLVLSESIGITDTLSRTLDFTRTLTESITITENLAARVTEYAINIAETIGITELVSVGIEISIVLSESIDIVDNVITPLNWKKRDVVSTTWKPRTKNY